MKQYRNNKLENLLVILFVYTNNYYQLPIMIYYTIKTFLYSQYNYCQLVWIYHNRTNNNKTNHLHERCFCLICNDRKSYFENLLEKDGSVSIIHQANLGILVVEFFKVFKVLSPVIIKKAFSVRQLIQYSMRKYSYSLCLIPKWSTMD